MYLAYASAHAGSEFLEGQDAGSTELLGADDEINYEQLGYNPQPLPTPEEGKAMQAKAAALVPAQSESEEPTPTPAPEPAEGDDIANENRGDSPESERGESPHSGEESPQNLPVDSDGSDTEKSAPEGDAEPGE
ncbi:MAG TPA: hypothetical protein VK034_15535 [Enhygromyxa sp.]|nr:hypothetical protein [Enhygromyxa sp.]